MTPEDLARLDAEQDAARAKLEAPEALARAARWYASNGIAVFPLRPGTKAPLFGKAHREDAALQRECKRACGQDGHGLYDATTDAATVERWWRETPQANIGLRTGLLFDVLDVDGPAGIRVYCDQIQHGACPRRADGVTPSCCDDGHCPGDGGVTLRELVGDVLGEVGTGGDNGGFHLYIRPTGDANGTNVLPHIDYRGDGGYVVAPPSRVRKRYSWYEPLDLDALHRDAAA